MESLAVMPLFYLSNQGRLLRGGSIEQGQKEARERNGTIRVGGGESDLDKGHHRCKVPKEGLCWGEWSG